MRKAAELLGKFLPGVAALCAICALAAPIAEARQAPERPLRWEKAVITSGTLLALPGQPVRVALSPPDGFDHDGAIWMPLPVEARIIDHESYGLEQDRILAKFIGFTAKAPDREAAATTWLGNPVAWKAVTPDGLLDAEPAGPVHWMLFLRLPARFDDAGYRTPVNGRERAIVVQIDRERFPVRLAPEPDRLPFGRIPVLEASREAWRSLGDRLAVEARDPTRRWRVGLLTERFSAQRLFGTDSLEERVPMPDPILRGVARSFETEWRSAISSLEQSAPDEAAQILARLTAVSRLPDGFLLPVWPTDGEAEGILLPSLLTRSMTTEQRASAASAYLTTQPGIHVTVLDDAGRSLDRAETPRFREGGEIAETILTSRDTTVLLTELSTQSSTLTLGPLGEFDSELVRLDPAQTVVRTADVSAVQRLVPEGADRGANPTGTLAVRREQKESRAEFRVAPLDVRRPGRPLGPALEPFDLNTWNISGGRITPRDWQTGVFVFRDGPTGSWKLYLEARFPRDLPDLDPSVEQVRVHLGPYGQSDAIVTVSPGDDRAVASGDRWSAVIDIPGQALDRAMREGTLAIGFIRSDSRSTILGEPGRSSWPRPLLPGATEPGRFRLDLSAWDGGSR